MNIRIDQFCYLSSAPAFLAWLYEFSPELYNDLLEHTRRKPSCKANADKMMSLLPKISGTPDGEQRLTAFLRQQFPYVLGTASPPKVVPRPINTDPVFGHYDPDLLSVPRRKVIKDVLDPHAAARAFIAQQAIGEYVVVGGAAYVEYIPESMRAVISKIPAKNWKVREYKATHPVGP